MAILLCAATEMELKPTLNFLEKNGLKEKVGFLCTGVGLLHATHSLTKKVVLEKPTRIIQAGIAGCFDSTRKLGEVVLIDRELVGDLGVIENGQFHSLARLGFQEPDMHPWKGGWLLNDDGLLDTIALPKVSGITINEISTASERIEHYRNIGAIAETMEGAALHYVALSENVPFLQLRAFSNYVGERDKSRWQLDSAIASLNRELEKLLTQFLSS